MKMVETFKLTLARFLAHDYIKDLEDRATQAENKANLRMAQVIGQMDPFEPLLKKYSGVFSDNFERAEEDLDTRSEMSFLLWAYTQDEDPNFKHWIRWMINSQGNQAIRKGFPTPDTILYSRALIANAELMKSDIKRLANLYREKFKKDEDDFEEGVAVE